MFWTIQLFDGRFASIQADEITTRADGSLWLLNQKAPPPDRLVPAAVLARDLWCSCYPQGAEIVWNEQPTPSRFAAK